MQSSLDQVLNQNSNANILAYMNLGRGSSVAVWENQKDYITYSSAKNHAFSLYLQGGTGTRRIDAKGASGKLGNVCILPEGHSAEWEILSPFRFLHVYLSDERLRGLYSEINDCDAREVNTEEQLFIENSPLRDPLTQFSNAVDLNDKLLAETALLSLISKLPGKQCSLRGGLPRYILRRIDEWIVANLEESISLEGLANIANMSTYHFHKMFRLSRGVTPHEWVTQYRIRTSKEMLRRSMTIIDVATACGFSHQSHFNRVFRNRTSMSPGQYKTKMLDL